MLAVSPAGRSRFRQWNCRWPLLQAGWGHDGLDVTPVPARPRPQSTGLFAVPHRHIYALMSESAAIMHGSIHSAVSSAASSKSRTAVIGHSASAGAGPSPISSGRSAASAAGRP